MSLSSEHICDWFPDNIILQVKTYRYGNEIMQIFCQFIIREILFPTSHGNFLFSAGFLRYNSNNIIDLIL